MKIDNQRLRTLTTDFLHTKIECVYEDLELITGESGLMTHMLPRAMRAVGPWLREHVKDARFWDGKFDPTHTGETELPEPTQAERDAMFEHFKAQPNPLLGKSVVVVNL